ncbi:MAG: flippase-like domain-containing protein [Chitinophagaceae bacterium]|nr:flippase-like domain-containing protein [Chitinophagaceae bacterium]
MVGPLLFCLLAYSIYHQIQRQPNWKDSFLQIIRAFDSTDIWKLMAVCFFMLLNWGLEARKWQLVIRRIQPISWIQALKAIFTGTTLAFFTPNRMGEYIGRVLYIEEGKRIKAVSLTIVCSMAQLLVTIVLGIAGVIFIRQELLVREGAGSSVIFWMNLVLYISIPVALILTLFYFKLSWVVRWVEKIPFIEKFTNYIRVLDNFEASTLLSILSLSVLRYGVFVIQYYWLFDVFKVELNEWQVFWSVSVVFLVLAIVPSIALLTELGVRWQTSIEVIRLFSTNVVGILATSLAIWMINLVIPALVGSLLILNIRLFNLKKNRNE